jgi:hypothetical protein
MARAAVMSRAIVLSSSGFAPAAVVLAWYHGAMSS